MRGASDGEDAAAAAQRFLAGMTALECRFELSGPDHDLRWHYEAAPGMRERARAFMLAFERPPFSFDAAMVTAIRSLQSGGAS